MSRNHNKNKGRKGIGNRADPRIRFGREFDIKVGKGHIVVNREQEHHSGDRREDLEGRRAHE